MNREQLVNNVAERTGLSKKNARDAVDAVLDSIGGALAGGTKVSILGFGSFETVSSKERQGRNPATGAAITIPAKRKAKFKPGKGLDDLLNA